MSDRTMELHNLRRKTQNQSGYSAYTRLFEEFQQVQGGKYAKWVSSLAILPILFGLTACLSSSLTSSVEYANRKAEADDSPFRWKAKTVPGGSILTRVLADLPSEPSRADPVLKQDTLALIAKMEAVAGRTDPQVEDVKLMKDRREVWLLRSGSDGIAYIVNFRQSAHGGTDIELSKPEPYRKD
jgi:hypothetical protein